MSIKAKIEAIIYATEEPVTLNQLAALLKDDVLAALRTQDDAQQQITDAVEPDSSTEASADAEPLPAQDTSADQPSQHEKDDAKRIKAYISEILGELTAEYGTSDHGIEVRQLAGGYRMCTKPEHHDVVIGFAKSLKPPIRLSLQALETLAVIAYKQPVTVPEISEIRGVDTSGVIATLLDRKLITTAGRKQVIGRPILYKTTKEFLLRFGLNNVAELPSMEEFEKLGDAQGGLFAEDSLSAPEGATDSTPQSNDEAEKSNPASVEDEAGSESASSVEEHS